MDRPAMEWTRDRVLVVLEHLWSPETSRPECAAPAIDAVTALQTAAAHGGHEHVVRACQLLKQWLIADPGEETPGETAARIRLMREACYYVMRHAEAMEQGGLPPSLPGFARSAEPAVVPGPDGSPPDDPSPHGAGAVTVVATDDAAYLHIPAPASRQTYDEILATLHRVFAEARLARNWVVDLADLPEVPHSLIWALYSFRHELREQGLSLRLVGVDPSRVWPRSAPEPSAGQ